MAKKKTKKDKVIADYRRKIQLMRTQRNRGGSAEPVEVIQDSPVKRTASKKSDPSNKTIVNSSLSLSEKAELDRQAKLIKGDLKKTVVLSVFGIGIVFSLYFFGPF